MQKFFFKISAILTKHSPILEITDITKFIENIGVVKINPQMHANITYKSDDAPTNDDEASTDIRAAIYEASKIIGDTVSYVNVQSKNINSVLVT